MLGMKIFFRFLKVYLKSKITKHVESLPKIDKSITFHYCIVICDVLQPIRLYFLQRQHKLYLIFLRFHF